MAVVKRPSADRLPLLRTQRRGRRAPRRTSGDVGASAVEYALVVGGIAAVVVALVFLFGSFVSDSFAGTCETLRAQLQRGADCRP